jgi:hypothetical protein
VRARFFLTVVKTMAGEVTAGAKNGPDQNL